MRTTTRTKPVMNGNAAHMKAKYNITHMIAACHYEHLYVGAGKSRSERERKEGEPMVLEGESFPWCLLHDLSQDLTQMAGWEMPDNKVTFLVIMNGNPTLLNFYDSTVTLVRFSSHWDHLPGNAWGRDRERVEKAYKEWKRDHDRMWELRRHADKARYFSAEGRTQYEPCTKCGEKTHDKVMGTPMCRDCRTCSQCGCKARYVHDLSGRVFCEDCMPRSSRYDYSGGKNGQWATLADDIRQWVYAAEAQSPTSVQESEGWETI